MTTANPDTDRTTSSDEPATSTTSEADRTDAASFPATLVERLRQPEYVGENRCLPCTIVNVGIAVILGAGIGYVVLLASRRSAVAAGAGGVFLLAAFGAISLRGYLVPYTPTLTKRYLPDRVLRWFEHHDQQTAVESLEDIDVEELLVSIGVIGECEQQNDLCLTPSFQRRWRDGMEEIREMDRESREAAVTELLELDDEHTVEEYGNTAAIVMVDGTQVAQWESDAAFVADLAADELLREWSDRWSAFSIPERGQLLNSLRMFLQRCPTCDSPVTMGQDTVQSCCRSRDVVAVTCSDCDSRIFEVEVTPELQAQL